MTLEKLTQPQLNRLFRRIQERIQRAFAGGTRYGVDMPTLWACHPGLATAYMNTYNELKARYRRANS